MSGVSFDEQRPRPDGRVSRALRGDAGFSLARPNLPERDGARRPLTFTIPKYAARRLHYDLRLEIDGVLVSWPIPQGPSYDPNVRRLAIQTEDHLHAYGTFEGIIPAGEYGGGEVIVWGLRHLHGPSRKMGCSPTFAIENGPSASYDETSARAICAYSSTVGSSRAAGPCTVRAARASGANGCSSSAAMVSRIHLEM